MGKPFAFRAPDPAMSGWMARTVRCLLPALALVPSAAFAQDTIRFAAFGDYGPGSGTKAVAKLVNDQAPDFIVSLGDSCYGATPPIATQVGVPYGNWVTNGRFWPALGNHEFTDACGGTAASGYFDYFTLPNNERYYDFVQGPVHFFALNSATEPDGKKFTSKQALWLKNKLAASTSPWQVVFFHHPPYSSGQERSVLAMRWPFEAWGVDAVLTSHSHDYERIHQDANADGVILPYFVSGLGGKSKHPFVSEEPGSVVRYNAAYGAMFITASATAIDFEFRNVSDIVIDSYSITQPTAPAPTQFEWKMPPQSTNGRRRQ